MADIKKLISLQNLTDYDGLIKQYVDSADAKSIKTVLWDATEEKIKFYKKENASLATDTADYEVAISSTDVANLKTRVGLGTNLTAYQSKSDLTGIVNVLTGADTVDGSVAKVAKDAVSALEGTLADVATSGAAVDVAVADEAGKLTATNVEGALLEIVNKADANATAISTLNGDADVDGSVAKKIADAIGGLDAEDTAVTGQFVTAVSEADGVISVTRSALSASDIPDLTLAKITDAGTAAASDVSTTEIGAETEVGTALPTVAQVKKYVTDSVADLAGATHFIGVKEELPETANSGDICIVGVKEYIYDGENWVELGDETIYVTKTTTIAGVDLENNVTKEELLGALNVADGAQVNVIEEVKVNGTALEVSDKAVNVTVATGTTNGTLAVNGADIAVAGLGSAAYTDASAYEEAGAVATAIAGLDATVSTVTEEDPTPVVNLSITETDGKLTAVTASIKAETFDAYGSADAVKQALDYEVATTTEISNLFLVDGE